MAMVVSSNPSPPPPQPSLKLHSSLLAHIDTSTLSQSELHSLSLCSSSAFDLRRTDQLVVPKIDRSLFNESAGSRRQTYSRPRRSQSSSPTSSSSVAAIAPTGHRRRVAGLLPVPKLPPVPADDPERNENRAILNHLKHLISQDPKFDYVELSPPSLSASMVEIGENPVEYRSIGVFEGRGEMGLPSFGGERKRKRGRKPKVKVLNLETQGYLGLEMVNRNGVAVDLLSLANMEDPYGEELKRRTFGLDSEEKLLGFMRELSGQWGSRRKKRKIVDASEFGDALPVGWKLLLGLKRKEGRAWIYCRRYISPTGQHFICCKDVASYLQSFGISSTRPNGQRDENIPEYRPTAESQHAGLTYWDGDQKQDINSSLPLSTNISNEQEKEIALLGMENLAEVQIHDLFECHKCSMTFDEKDSYLQHLLSFHQRTTRRYRLGSSVGDGVIIKDGKYECQFCHKVFLERRRYNGHVGIHVRNYVRRVEELPVPIRQKRIQSPPRDDLPSTSRISKMDALIEIAQSSILENATAGPNERSKSGSAPDQPHPISSPEIPASNSDQEMNFDSPLSEQELEGRMIKKENDPEDSAHMSADGSMEKPSDRSEIVDVKMDACLDDTNLFPIKKQDGNASKTFSGKEGLAFIIHELNKSCFEREGASESGGVSPSGHHVICDVDSEANINENDNLECVSPVEINNKGNEMKVDVDSSNDRPTNDIMTDSIQKTSEGKELQGGVSDSSMSMVQQSHCFPPFDAASDKGEQVSGVDQKNENITGFEELRLDELEAMKYNFETVQESLPLQEVPIELTSTVEMEGEFGSSVQFVSEDVMLNVDGRHQLTTVCVWCGVEFNHETVDSELQPDSVGFMCPNCKAKISGQLNVLDSGSPVHPHSL
ncbi:uncharacterized protein LOC107427828 isoform X1 [Ziziphus jujuba]|uniref:Uncharacterized protein LOC107427828 isoform X1 n=1 Tax=Ziziphus jujuba TaxID=326968 RepID=A0A6P4AGE8_ZIZJJ|nr:uncharacterized protein LOC107427828 isoform X1 [Ziziphus jujuba]XP_048336765.2 uncharacterized protein LOC107427828 isoform X1 [Ziziphus jujuba]XP_048336766.2 uncharacterized protein LOC107427828 isoform X1 [Ziziphus jujuba]